MPEVILFPLLKESEAYPIQISNLSLLCTTGELNTIYLSSSFLISPIYQIRSRMLGHRRICCKIQIAYYRLRQRCSRLFNILHKLRCYRRCRLFFCFENKIGPYSYMLTDFFFKFDNRLRFILNFKSPNFGVAWSQLSGQ
jgi:hypothetical protein